MLQICDSVSKLLTHVKFATDNVDSQNVMTACSGLINGI